MELKIRFNPGGDKPESRKVKTFVRGMPKNMPKGLLRMGAFFEAKTKKNLKASNPTKLLFSPHRELRSRSGMLRRSITHQVFNAGQSMKVGPNVVYERIHIFPRPIKITDKMRRLLHAIGIHPKASTTHIKVKKRDYFFPVIKKNLRKGIRIFQDSIFGEMRRA